MKLLPAFEYLFLNQLIPCVNNIGFRYDEQYRVKKFYFDKEGKPKNPHHFYYPTSQNIFGQKRLNYESVYWRHASFPLIINKISKPEIINFWKNKSINFPAISNCVGCFHKDPYILNKMAKIEPEKMEWFSKIENFQKVVRSKKTGLQRPVKMGTWLDSLLTYKQIIEMNFTLDIDFEYFPSCDSGSCHD